MIAHATPLADWLVVLPIIIGIIGSAILLVTRPFVWVQGYVCGIFIAAILAGDGLLLQRVLHGGPLAMTMGKWLPPFGISFAADAMGAGFALVAAFVAFCVWLSMLATVPESAVRKGIYPLVLLLLSGVSGAVLTGDLFNLYVWFEVMLIASFGLFALAGAPLQLEGALKYGVISLVGTTIFLLALGLLYGLVGTLSMADVIAAARRADPALLAAIAALFLLAFATKAAVFPLGAWLPASYHTPPATISALVAALLTKVGIYALLRLMVMLLPETGSLLSPAFAALAVATMVLGPFAALAETSLRRAIGFILIGGVGVAISCLAQPDQVALSGGVAYMLNSALTLAALYLLAGAIENATAEREAGLYVSRPMLSLCLLALLLAVSGVPPFLGFWPKLLLLQGYLAEGNWLLVFGVLANALLTLIAGARLWSRISWRGPAAAIGPAHGYGGAMLASGTVLVLSLAPGLLIDIASAAARDLLGPAPYIAAVGLAP